MSDQLIQLFEETFEEFKEKIDKNIDSEPVSKESPVPKESLAFFLAANTKPHKSSTEISIQVPEDGVIPNIATHMDMDASTILKQTDDDLRKMFANKPVEPPKSKTYNAKIIINGKKDNP
jgi:hypothetical protein